MKINITILSVLILLTAGWTWQSNHKNNVVTKNVETLATDFSYTTIDGLKSSLYNHKNKVIFVHFWASWCAPCIVEFPDLLKLAASQKENFIILAVSTDEKKLNIKNFLKKLKMGIPKNVQIIQDVDNFISWDLYQTTKLPETFVISPDLTLAEKIVGPQEDWNSAIWRRKILRLQSKSGE